MWTFQGPRGSFSASMGHGEVDNGEVGSGQRNRVQLEILFGLAHVLILTLLGFWGWSTWANRQLLFVRVRRPRLLLLDLLQSAFCTSIICITEMLVGGGVALPCRFQHLMALLFMLTNPAVVIWRGIQLWNGFAATDTKDLTELYRIRTTTNAAKVVPSGLALTAIFLSVSGAQLCFSDKCMAHCYFGSQHLLLIPVVVITNLESYATWRMLRTTHKVERVGLLTEVERFVAFSAPLVLLGFLFTILVDLDLMQPRQGNALSSLCWLLAIVTKFIVIHVGPSLQFGYAPSLHRYWRVAPLVDGGPLEGQVPHLESSAPFSQRNRDYNLMDKEGIVEALQRARYRRASLASAALVSGRPGYGDDGNSRASVSNWQSRQPSVQPGRRSSVQPPATPRRSSVLPSQQGSDQLSGGVGGPEEGPDDQALSIWEMSMDHVMASENDVLPDFLAFCQSLLCDHMLLFLLALRPYHQREGDLQPRVLPEDTLRAVYTSYIKVGASRTVPLPTNLAKAIRQYCQPMAGDTHLQGMWLKPITEESLESTSSAKDTQRLDRTISLRETMRKTKEVREVSTISSDPVSPIGMLMELAYLEIEALLAEEALPMFKAYMQEAELEAAQPKARRRSSIFSGLSVGGFKRPAASVLPLATPAHNPLPSPRSNPAPGPSNAPSTPTPGPIVLQPTIVIHPPGTRRASQEVAGAVELTAPAKAENKAVQQDVEVGGHDMWGSGGGGLLSLLDDLSDEAAVAPHRNSAPHVRKPSSDEGFNDSAKPYRSSGNSPSQSSRLSSSSSSVNVTGGDGSGERQPSPQATSPLFDSSRELLRLLEGSGGNEQGTVAVATADPPGQEKVDAPLPAPLPPSPFNSCTQVEQSSEQPQQLGQPEGQTVEAPEQQGTAAVCDASSPVGLSKEELQRQEEDDDDLKLLSMFEELEQSLRQERSNSSTSKAAGAGMKQGAPGEHNPLWRQDEVRQESLAQTGGLPLPEDGATARSVEAELADTASPIPFLEPGDSEQDAIVLDDKPCAEVSTAEQGAAPRRGIEGKHATSCDEEKGEDNLHLQPIEARTEAASPVATGEGEAAAVRREHDRAEEGRHTQPASGAAERDTGKAEEQGTHVGLLKEEQVGQAASADNGLSREHLQAEGSMTSPAPQSQLVAEEPNR